jgi:hypothetical protein
LANIHAFGGDPDLSLLGLLEHHNADTRVADKTAIQRATLSLDADMAARCRCLAAR